MSKVKVAFVGVGSMGQCAHLKNYAVLEECEVVALAELRPGLAERVAERYNVPNVYPSFAEMIGCEQEIDAFVASQPFNRHGVLVPEVLAAGKPVFTEKPLAASVEVGRKIVEAVKASGTWMMLGYHKRSDPATMLARAEIDRLKASEELGKMRYVRIVMPPGNWVAGGFNDLIRSDEPFPEMAWDPRPSDMDEATFNKYNAFVNYYIHQVNLMRHLLGEPYKVTFADKSGVLLAVESASGVTGVIEMATYHTSIDWQESAMVTFERGWLRLDLPAPLASNRPGRLEIFKDPLPAGQPQSVVPRLPWVHAMRQQALNFLAAVKGERPPLTTAEEALEDLNVAREYIRLWTGK